MQVFGTDSKYVYICSCAIYLFFPQEALSKVISASLCENSNWQDLELLVEHIVAVF